MARCGRSHQHLENLHILLISPVQQTSAWQCLLTAPLGTTQPEGSLGISRCPSPELCPCARDPSWGQPRPVPAPAAPAPLSPWPWPVVEASVTLWVLCWGGQCLPVGLQLLLGIAAPVPGRGCPCTAAHASALQRSQGSHPSPPCFGARSARAVPPCHVPTAPCAPGSASTEKGLWGALLVCTLSLSSSSVYSPGIPI